MQGGPAGDLHGLSRVLSTRNCSAKVWWPRAPVLRWGEDGAAGSSFWKEKGPVVAECEEEPS